jgi:hypothetical protein
LEIGGDADQPQFVVEGFSTQTDSLIIAQNDADTQVFNVDVDGNVLSQGIEDIDGPGTNWEITAAGAATFAGAITGDSLSTGASTTPTVGFDDSDDAGTSDEAAIVANAPTANDGDLSFQVNSGADSLATFIKIDTTDAGVSCAQFGDIGGGNYWEVCEDTATLQGQGTHDINVPANSIDSSDISTEVRSMVWQASALSADGTECSDPAEVTINSGPKAFTLACPMGTAETDGFIYGGPMILPDGFDKTADVTFELSAYLTTDSGAGTWHGEVAIQCQTEGEIVDSTWGTGIGLDLTPAVGDVVNDVVQDASAAVDTDTTGEDCAGGDVLWWRWKSCDTDATPSTGCTSSAGFENDMSILAMKMEYTSNVGD